MALSPETGVAVTAIGLYLVNEASKYIKKSIETRGKGKLFTRSVDVLREIKDITTEVRGRFQANRVAIFEYSNTETSIAGVPFKFINMTYESTDSNTVKLAAEFNKVPVATHIDTLSYLNSHPDRFILVNEGDSHVPEEMLLSLKQYNNKSIIHFKLSPQLYEGTMTIEFSNDRYDVSNVEVVKADVEFLKVKAQRIKELMAKLKK